MPDDYPTESTPLERPSDVETLKEFANLNEWSANGIRAQVKARIVRKHSKVFMDLREYQETPNFKGFTKRGLRLSEREIKVLLNELLPQALQYLQSYYKGEVPCPTSQVVTDAVKDVKEDPN